MATNLAIDDGLLDEARRLSGIKTKRETVNLALREFIRRYRIEELIEEFHSVELEAGWDYKQSRER